MYKAGLKNALKFSSRIWDTYVYTPFAPGKWPFKRGGLSSGVDINTFMFRFTLSRGLSRGGGLSSEWPLKRGSTV